MTNLGLALFVCVSLGFCSDDVTSCGWIPGDAFFAGGGYRIVKETGIPELQFADVGFRDPPVFRDYVGFHFLRITGNATRIKSSLDYLVGDNPNEYYYMIYQKGFVQSSSRLGLKYNENWHERPQQASTSRKSFPTNTGVYTSLVTTPSAILMDWRKSRETSGLDAITPREVTDWARPGELIKNPIRISANQIAVVVVRCEDIRKLCVRKLGSAWIVGGSGDITQLSYSNSGVRTLRSVERETPNN